MHPIPEPDPQPLLRPDGTRLAVRRRSGAGPTFVWMGGFHSDMAGSKAVALDAWCARTGRACVRFDWFGHGLSDGAFEDGTITRWADDALAIVDATEGPLVLVGSSMGGWMALLTAVERTGRVRGLNLIAPAPDFTEDLMWADFDAATRSEIETTGRWMRPSAYGDAPYPITKALIESGRERLILRGPIAFDGPVRIVHGQADEDVPWERSLALMTSLTSADVRATFVKAGDHRLSTPADLALHEAVWSELAETCA